MRNANDGLGALLHLEREYGSHDPNDRAAAVSRISAKYIDPKSPLSEDDLRYQFDQMQLANADIVAAGGTQQLTKTSPHDIFRQLSAQALPHHPPDGAREGPQVACL